MKKIIGNFLLFLLIGAILPSVTFASNTDVLVASVIFVLLSVTLGNILKLVTIPLNFITLGLVWTAVNWLLLGLTEFIVEGFIIDGFFPLVVMSAIISFVGGYIADL